MRDPTLFARLCDVTDALQREVHRLPLCPAIYDLATVTAALEAIVDRLDVLIDATIGLEVPALAEEDGIDSP
jgi:hypothetical protein